VNLFSIRRPAPSLDDLILDAQQDDPSGESLMPTVARPPHVFVRGQGSWLWDSDDRAYLDFSQGNGANSLGHSPQVLINALTAQTQALINPGMGLHNRAQLNLVDRLCHRTGSDQAHLLNSGAEACETAIKLARKWGQLHRGGAYRTSVPATVAMAAVSRHWRHRPPPWKTVSSRNCPVSAMCRSRTCRPCMPPSMHKPLPSCSNRSKAPA
jgi:4-aminobutyrate aminotransferase-like enzyme